MAKTFTQLTIHVVFTVKGRENLIRDHFSEQLFKYIHGILINLGQTPLIINGYKDHVHILFELSPDYPLAKVIQRVKTNSSRWINEHKLVEGRFGWQIGYGAFSNSRSHRKRLIEYIKNQEKHHSTSCFRTEYMGFLRHYGIEFKEKNMFEFYT